MKTDSVFQLGWIDEPGSASTAVAILADLASSYLMRGLSEDDTRAIFLEPLLRGLGWDTLDISDVGRSKRTPCPVGDVWLMYQDEGKDKAVVVIEAKSLSTGRLERELKQLDRDINDRFIEAGEGCAPENMKGEERSNWEHRLEHNGKVFVYGVLTNGRRWDIYDFTTGHGNNNEPSRTPIYEFDLEVAKTEKREVQKLLKILGKDAIHIKAGKFAEGL